MTALPEQSGLAQSRGQALLDLSCLRPRYARQVQRRPGEQLEAPAQYAACRTNPGLVLIEAIGGRVTGHADVDPKGFRAAVAVVEQHQVEGGRTPALRGKPPGHFLGPWPPLDLAHPQPIRNRFSR